MKKEFYILRNKINKALSKTALFAAAFLICSVVASSQSQMLTGIEMIVNGDFEDDTTGIISDYHYSSINLKPEGYWSVLKNPYNVFYQFSHCSDHTTGNGHMMCINGHYEHNKTVWQQTVDNVRPNTTFLFSMWYTSVNPTQPAHLSIYINNEEIDVSPIQLTSDTCQWHNISYDWNSGNSNSATIKIVDNKTITIGNDFALDDISFMPYCTVNADAGNDQTICYGEKITIGNEANGGYPPYEYEWLPNTGIVSTNEHQAEIDYDQSSDYIVKVTDAIGCIDYDTVSISVVPEISFEIGSNVEMPACPCETVILYGPEGYNYHWSTGETTKDISVTEPGDYSLTVETSEGCSETRDFFVDISTAEFFVEIEDAQAKSGENIEIPMDIYVSNDNERCNFDDFFMRLKYNKSLLIPRLPDGFIQYTDGKTQVIEYDGNINNFERSLKFLATLGNSQCTDIIIDAFDIGCEEVRMNLNNGRFCSSDICTDPTPRLFDDTGQLFLAQNTPNPASTTTSLKFGLIETGNTRISLVNSLGEEVDLITDKIYDPGSYSIEYDVSDLSPGVYFIMLETPSQFMMKRLDVVK